MSQILVCPYCNSKINVKKSGSSVNWIECECGGVFTLEEGIPESEKRRIAAEKERKENELKVRHRQQREMEQRQRSIDQSVEWLRNNDTNAIFLERLLGKIIAQNEELIELNKNQIALLNRIAIKPMSSAYAYSPSATTNVSTPEYGPNEYLRDKKIYEMEGKHSVAGHAAYRRARDYELGV